MANELIVNASLPETRIALMENGEIQELLIERASGKGIVGNIYKGRVTRVLPGMQAAFVDIGLEKAAFLYVDDVFVHSQVFEDEAPSDHSHEHSSEGGHESAPTGENEGKSTGIVPVAQQAGEAMAAGSESQSSGETSASEEQNEDDVAGDPADESFDDSEDSDESEEGDDSDDMGLGEDDESEDEDPNESGPVAMGPPPSGGDDEEGGSDDSQDSNDSDNDGDSDDGDSDDSQSNFVAPPGGENTEGGDSSQQAVGGQGPREGGRRNRRGRRGGRNRKRGRDREPLKMPQGASSSGDAMNIDPNLPSAVVNELSDGGTLDTDRGVMDQSVSGAGGSIGGEAVEGAAGRPDVSGNGDGGQKVTVGGAKGSRPEFKEQRGRDRRVRPKTSSRPPRQQAKIEELLKEGQEILVQVAKDPIATKGARLTCHISLPGRHLVCMPTIDHVGVSRRIDRDDERRRLRDFVEKNRPKKLGFIVRTASGKNQSEKRLKQDIDYLTHLWDEIREKSQNVSAPALVYEDLNAVLRSIRDWVNEDIDKVVVDSRYHFNEMQKFVSHFMPSLRQKVELYNGDIPIFDAYSISTELARALERKVWLKSGGYLVIDQAEALVAIDVNTGRFVGKKSLEDTILKTNLEAVQEIAYQLRLRNCGGIIILDLIDMEKEENKQRVYRALEDALKKDRARPSILKISELGLVEMTRKRTRDTIIRTLCESCTHCEAKGYIKSKQSVAYEILREIERVGTERYVSKILVQAHSEVIDILAIEERETMDQLERRYRKQVYLQVVTDYHPEQFEVIAEKPDQTSTTRSDRNGTTDRHAGGHDRNERGGHGGQGGGRDRGRGRDRGHDRNQSGGRDRNEGRRPGGHGGQGGGAIIPSEGGIAIMSSEGRERVTISTPPPVILARSATIQPAQASQAGDAQVTPANLSDNMEGATLATPEMGNSSAGNAGGMRAPAAPSADDFFDEEDRLAFLRAQAAQDAALARLGLASGQNAQPGHAGGGGQQSKNGHGDRNGGGRGGRRDRNKRRGGGGGQGGGGGKNGGRFGNQNRFQNRGPQMGGSGAGIQPVADRGGDAQSSAPVSSAPQSGGGSDSSSDE